MRRMTVWTAMVGLAMVVSGLGRESFAARQREGGPGGGRRGMGMGPGGGMGGGMGGPMMHPEFIEGLAAELGVAAPALAQIKTLAYNANKEAIDLRAELERLHLDMRQLMDQDKPDTKKIMQSIDQVGSVETKLRKNRVQLLLSVRELLTPEQRGKLQRVIAERRGNGRGPGGAGGPGFDDGPHAE